MKKIDPTVINETKYISAWILILSVFMQAVFLIIGKWDYTVLLGNILSAFAAIINFLLMGVTIQNALTKDEKDSKTTMKFSQIYRNLLMLLIMVIGVVFPCFNTWTVIIPIFFPRFAIAFRPLFDKKKS